MVDVHLLNLDCCVDRLERFNRLNAGLPIHFIREAAIDGAKVDRQSLIDRKLLDPAGLDLYGNGALGCALSHLALWQRAIATQQMLTICEDDVIFNHGFAEAHAAALRSLPSEWHVVLWGWNFDSYLTFDLLPGVSPCCAMFDQKAMRSGVAAFQKQPVQSHCFRLFRAFGTCCYSISPGGAALLVQHCLPLRPMSVFFPGLNRLVANTGIDIMMNDCYPTMQAFVSFPPLVIVENDRMVSTVQPETSPVAGETPAVQ